MKYSHKAMELKGSATLQFTARAAAMKAEGRDIVSLTAGQPDFPTPEPAIQAAERAMAEGKTLYTPSAGILELREAVASRWGERRGVDYSVSSVLVSCGAKHSIANLLEAAVDPGDRVLVPLPYWVSYPEMILRLGATPVFPDSAGMLLTASDVRKAAAEGATGMIFNSPSNPTGLVNDAAEVEAIAEAVRDTGMWVISDDIYEDLYYGQGTVPHILDHCPELSDRVAVVTGVSKTYAMTGWRIGFALAGKEWIGIASRIQAHTTSNPCSISQYAALSVVRGEAEEERVRMFAAFERRRDLICDLLSGVRGLEFQVPQGAFYVYPRIAGTEEVDSTVFCVSLLEEEGLGTIPGSAFGTEGYIRLSFAASDDDIAEAVTRLDRFLERGDFR